MALSSGELSCHRQRRLAAETRALGVQLRHDSGALTRVVDDLAERGLLERVRRNWDRRKVELQLTSLGRGELERLSPCVVEKFNLVLEPFSGTEKRELDRLPGKLSKRLQSSSRRAAGGGIGRLKRTLRSANRASAPQYL